MKLGIIGWPLGYSLSPVMHNAALAAAGLKGEYKEIPVSQDDLTRWLESEAPKMDGFNVTMPHKEQVYKWLQKNGSFGKPFSELTRDIGAVNTVKIENGKLVGYNTDGPGFMAPLDFKKIKGKKALLLGAGGSARSIALYLIRAAGIGRLWIHNRNLDRAQRLKEKLSPVDPSQAQVGSADVDVVENPNSVLADADLLVNATPAGMFGHNDLSLDYGRLQKSQMVYDLVYEPKETLLIREARARGCAVITGDRMLAAQGAEAFRIWTNQLVEKTFPVMTKALDGHFAGRL